MNIGGPGSFVIYGKKNYTMINGMELGFSFLFKISNQSLSKHQQEWTLKEIETSKYNYDVHDDQQYFLVNNTIH